MSGYVKKLSNFSKQIIMSNTRHLCYLNQMFNIDERCFALHIILFHRKINSCNTSKSGKKSSIKKCFSAKTIQSSKWKLFRKEQIWTKTCGKYIFLPKPLKCLFSELNGFLILFQNCSICDWYLDYKCENNVYAF